MFITSHAHVAVRAFNEMINAFFDIILRPVQRRPGLFGECVAYFGMVEVQDRGTLHLHLLIWIKGNPNPQVLRDRMQVNKTFCDKVLQWLEETIHCKLPGQTEVLSRTNIVQPVLDEGELDPRELDP